MQVPGRIAALAMAVFAVAVTPAAAADYCVTPATRDGCIEKPTLAAALAAADDDVALDRVFVGARVEESAGGAFADAPGRPVRILGTGAGATTLRGPEGSTPALRLSDPGSSARWITIARPSGATGPAVELMAGAELADAVVLGGIAALPGTAGDAPARALRLAVVSPGEAALSADRVTLLAESVDAVVTGAAPGLRAACSADTDAALVARHVTLTGSMQTGAVTVCTGARRADIALEDSVLAGTYTGGDGAFAHEGSSSTSSRATAWSWHLPDADVTAENALTPTGDPGFISGDDHRLRADSPLVDAGDPAPLAAGEGLYDAAGLVRVADGSGDGAVRRDVGAHERQPPAVPVPAGNVLANPGAEAVDPLAGWSGSGFEAALFGADDFFPTRAAAAVLGAGARFFAGGTAPDASIVQRIDIAGSADAIDAGFGSATLSALLGGYGADADEVRAEAIFRDPAGEPVGSIALAGPAPAERGNATNLLARAGTAPVPPRTRAVDVVLSAHRVAGAYTDGYADNLALTLSVPGTVVPGPVDPAKPVVPGLKPFAGVKVLTGRPPMSSKANVRVLLGCESATVGRCTGTMELRAIPKGRKVAVRIARFGSFSMRPGQTQRVIVKLLLARRREFLRHRSFRAWLHLVARDGQGLQRTTTVPVRVARSAPPRRR